MPASNPQQLESAQKLRTYGPATYRSATLGMCGIMEPWAYGLDVCATLSS